jgi:hypothetical protein
MQRDRENERMTGIELSRLGGISSESEVFDCVLVDVVNDRIEIEKKDRVIRGQYSHQNIPHHELAKETTPAGKSTTDIEIRRMYRQLSTAERLFIGRVCKKQLDLFWQQLKIIRKEGKFTFKIVGIG